MEAGIVIHLATWKVALPSSAFCLFKWIKYVFAPDVTVMAILSAITMSVTKVKVEM